MTRLYVDGLPPPTSLGDDGVPKILIAGLWIVALVAATLFIVTIIGGLGA